MSRPLKVLITHECSGVVRESFRALGHEAWSCDLKDADDNSPHHYRTDWREAVADRQWDFIGSHPVCTYLNGAGIHWNNRGRGWERTEEALNEIRELLAIQVPGYIENPVGVISSRIRKPDQIVQPYEFGDDASKKTCLWLRGLPVLKLDPRQMVVPRFVNNLPRWSNQTDSGQNKLAPSPNRAAKRAQSYPGISRQMALQWSEYLLTQ